MNLSQLEAPAACEEIGGFEAWLAERFTRHRGNAEVVRQDLLREQGIAVSLRTVERAVAGSAKETAPGPKPVATVDEAFDALAEIYDRIFNELPDAEVPALPESFWDLGDDIFGPLDEALIDHSRGREADPSDT